MGISAGRYLAIRMPTSKSASQFRIGVCNLDPVKLESLVIAHQPWRGEYVPGTLVHNRPSRAMESLGVDPKANVTERAVLG